MGGQAEEMMEGFVPVTEEYESSFRQQGGSAITLAKRLKTALQGSETRDKASARVQGTEPLQYWDREEGMQNW